MSKSLLNAYEEIELEVKNVAKNERSAFICNITRDLCDTGTISRDDCKIILKRVENYIVKHARGTLPFTMMDCVDVRNLSYSESVNLTNQYRLKYLSRRIKYLKNKLTIKSKSV